VGGLYNLTFGANFIGLILALWLGIYLVTHNAKYLIGWLTALTLWSVAGVFLNIMLAITPPPAAPYWPDWLTFLFPFWPERAFRGETYAWLQGWSIIPAIAFWHHATALMRPEKTNLLRGLYVLAGYLVAVIAIVVQMNSPILFTIQTGNPLYLNSLKAGQWYPFFGVALLLFTVSSIVNLVRAAAAAPSYIHRKQIIVLVRATVIAGLAGPLSLAASEFQLQIPIVGLGLLFGIPVILIGYGVARYSSLIEGRTILRDFLFSLAQLTLVVLMYLLLSWVLIQSYQLPNTILVFVPALAAITHSITNPAYRLMEPLFYRPNTRQQRSNLRHLLRLASEGKSFEDNLAFELNNLCTEIEASYGLIVIFEKQAIRKTASYHFRGNLSGLKPNDLAADDIILLSPGKFRPPLEDAALMVPLYADCDQLGTLVLGRPANGVQYAPEEIERLLTLTDQVSDVIYVANLKANYMRQMVELAETQHLSGLAAAPHIAVETVEVALRNLYNIAFLADSPLSKLALVQSRLMGDEITHLERGKIVHEVLIETLEKLCPQPGVLRDPPPREWHPYLILKDAYQEEKPNRDIMCHLYISEGTFNRTRRSALRSMARALGEMEAALT
jgi:hypothetical protein